MGEVPGRWSSRRSHPANFGTPPRSFRHLEPAAQDVREESKMSSRVDRELTNLLAQGKAQGYLTYEQVSGYLPDETSDTDRIDTLLAALDGLGIELVDGPNAHHRALAA